MGKVKLVNFDPAELLTTEASITYFLNSAFESGDSRYIKAALATVARARNMAQLAKKAGLTRAGLYRALDPDVDAKYDTIQRIMNALDVRLVVAKPCAKTPTRRVKTQELRMAA